MRRCSGSRRVDLAVVEPEAHVLSAGDLRRARGLLAPDLRDLLRGVDEATAVALRRVAHHDLVPPLHVARERPSAEDLEVVRMGADGEDSHFLAP